MRRFWNSASTPRNDTTEIINFLAHPKSKAYRVADEYAVAEETEH